MNPFERLMINIMDDFADRQMSLYELCDTRFRSMDTRFKTLNEQIKTV